MGYFLARALEHIDRTEFMLTAYAEGRRQGPLAERIRSAVTSWYDCDGMPDAEMANRIRADGIDLLIDLSGHTAYNRLAVFARKPAPVQLSWIGYPDGTGLAAMDYLLADRLVVPPGSEGYYRERIVRLPDSFACFDPPASAPSVEPLPLQAAGHVTLGSFNNPAKINDEVIAVWAAILMRLPQAKLLLKYKGFGNAGCRSDFTQRFAAMGIGAERLEFQGESPMAQMLEQYRRIDLAHRSLSVLRRRDDVHGAVDGSPGRYLPGRHFRQPPVAELPDGDWR